MKMKYSLLAGLLFAGFGAFSQDLSVGTSVYKQAEKVILDPQTKGLQYLRLRKDVHLTKAGFPAWLRETLQQPARTEWREYSVLADDLGFEHVRYQQYHYGVPVEGMVFIAHIRNGEVVSCNGAYKMLPDVAPAPRLNKQAAFQQGLQLTGANSYMWQFPSEEKLLKEITGNPKATYFPQAELVYAPANGNFDTDDFIPAYKMDIYASEPMDRSNVYMSAYNGQLLFKESLIHDIDSVGTAKTKYSGTKQIRTQYTNGTYRLKSNDLGVEIYTRNNQRLTNYGLAVEFTDADNFWDNKNPLKDEAATDAHWGAEVTFKYYQLKHNRNSFDNNGGNMWSFVHHDMSYNNAFWNGVCMTYGDGDGSFMAPLTALDIVGHEFTHGVTGNSARLIYRNESGALNESFSDIFGTAIDFYNNPTSANYLIGEQVMISGGALRNMQNPNQFNDPDTYNGKFWKVLNGPDNGGVHSNSGVQNFWFYLLVNGGQGVNDIGSVYNVNGIGMNKAERIAYRNLTVYLTQSSTYSVAAAMAVQAAEDIYGTCSAEAVATADAWYAVGVGQPYRIAASFVADNEYFCAFPATVKFTNLSHNANNYIWDFGDGQTSTAANPTHTYTQQGTYQVKLKALATTPICGMAVDSVVRTGYIRVNNGPTTVAACLPAPTTTPQANLGLQKVIFNTISKSSPDALEGNKDFSCNNITEAIAGNIYELTLETAGTPAQRAKAWIDYNNDGVFDPVTELVATYDPFILSATKAIATKANPVLNTPLRMRIGADMLSNGNITPCGPLQRGQYEDYSVRFTSQTAAPKSNFTVNQNYINVGTTVNFTDLSNFMPTSWKWSFPGGTPANSTQQNPTVTYSTSGFYSVMLITQNALGTDTLVKASYITVTNPLGAPKEFEQLNKLNVYPNPATDKVTIQFGAESRKPVTIALVNALGQQVMQQKTVAASQQQTELNVRELAAGVYFLRISDGGAVVTRKLILQKQ